MRIAVGQDLFDIILEAAANRLTAPDMDIGEQLGDVGPLPAAAAIGDPLRRRRRLVEQAIIAILRKDDEDVAAKLRRLLLGIGLRDLQRVIDDGTGSG